MDSNFSKLLDSGRRVFVDLKRNRVAGCGTYLSGASSNAVSHNSTLNSSSLKLGKRKKPDVLTKYRSRRIAPERSSTQYYTNFMKSGLPERLMFYQNGKWIDQELEVIAVVRKEFEFKKTAIEVKLSGHHLVFDFVSMVQFNFRTALELPIAWIDEVGRCFFPEIFIDDEQYECFHNEEHNEDKSSHHGEQEIKLEIEIHVNGVGDNKIVAYCGETSPLVKRIKVGQTAEVKDSCDVVTDVTVIEDVGENQNLKKKVNEVDLNLDVETVREMFHEGMNMPDGVDVVGIGANNGSIWHGRLELFMKQVELTKKLRDNANVCYAWLASSKEASASVMAYGLGHFGLQQIKSIYGTGVHLAAECYADSSAKYCDVDENGVRYMLLCRVIMGNMEMVHAGSNQFHPSSEHFDSGVDDLENPRQYVVWSMNINSHIYPQYVVSFKVTTSSEGSVIKNDGRHETIRTNHVHENHVYQFKAVSAIDKGNDHQPNGSKERTTTLNSTMVRAPKSPYMTLPVLLSAISKQVPSSDKKAVLIQYEQFRTKVINRKTFEKNLRLIVGDTILKTITMKLIRTAALKDGTVMTAQNPEG